MLESIKKFVQENPVPTSVFVLTLITVGGAYYTGYMVGSIKTLDLWRATNKDYELFGKFLEERDLLKTFNDVLVERGFDEGSLRFLLPAKFAN